MHVEPAAASATSRDRSTVGWALLLVLVVLPCFLTLGEPPLWDANEPLYAQPPKEVVSWPEGDFWAPTWNGKPYFAHPPLSTWITVPFYLWLGPNETAARLPMAIAAVLTVLAVFLYGRRLGGPRFGFLAGLALAAMPRYWLYARQLAGDTYFVAILAWAFLLALPLVEGRRAPWRLSLAAVLLGVGTLAKGPVLLVLHALALGLAWLLSRPRARLEPRRLLGFGLLVLLCAAPWFVYMSLRFPEFLGEYFGHYHFGRVRGTIGDRDPFFYVVALLGDAQPWILLLPFAAWGAWKRRERDVARLLPWAAIVTTFVLFSFSAGKRNVYMLPIYPMMAVAVAPLLLAIWRGARARLVSGAGLLLAVVALAAAGGLWLLHVRAPGLDPEIFYPFTVLLAGAVALAWAGWKGSGRAVTAAALGGIVVLEVAGALALPALGRFRPVPDLAREIAAREDRRAPEPAILYRVAIHSLNFYLGRATSVASTPAEVEEAARGAPRVFVVLREDRAPELLAGATSLAFEEVARGPYLTLQFSSVILGRGRVTRDLVLLEGRPRDAAPRGPGG